MKLAELKKEIEQYQYFEDTSIIDISLAAVIATRLQLGNPIWLIIIGASSGGKSQILRPIALTDTKFLHRVDDLTENTFLSGMKLSKGKFAPSLLQRVGEHGILVMSDLTVLFSKNAESRGAILSQFRMIYDGEMVKFSGTSDHAISWKGSLGVIAGSTPSIYTHFEEVADMGERFIYWRMKDYSAEKATKIAMNRKMSGRELDDKLSVLYADYIKEVVVAMNGKEIEIDEQCKERILKISMFSERVRTVVHTDWDKTISKLPVSAMPMRVALQLTAVAKGLLAMRVAEFGNIAVLSEEDYQIIDWCGYSLANEEKRACLRALCSSDFGSTIFTQTIADKVGLSTTIIGNILQNLASVGIVIRSGTDRGLTWTMANEQEWEIVRRVENISEKEVMNQRDLSNEENEESNKLADEILAKM